MPLPDRPQRRRQTVATRFRLRVLARRFSASFTPHRALAARAAGPVGKSRRRRAARADLHVATAERRPARTPTATGSPTRSRSRIKTDPCNADTDGDGVPDGYEYESALDLNSARCRTRASGPTRTRSYPTDANIDYDGDGLTMADEYSAWVALRRTRSFPLNYSDGTQNTGGPVAGAARQGLAWTSTATAS